MTWQRNCFKSDQCQSVMCVRTVIISLILFHIFPATPFLLFSAKIQETILETSESASKPPYTGDEYYAEEFAAMMLLFGELIRANLFSHDKYMCSLIAVGQLDTHTHVTVRQLIQVNHYYNRIMIIRIYNA